MDILFSKKVISLDMGSANIKIAIGRYKGKYVLVEDLKTISTPENSIDDGKIVNREDVEFSLKHFLKEKDIQKSEVICTLKSKSIINREFLLPMAKEDELLKMAKIEAQQYIPIVLDEYIIQYKLLEKINIDGMEKARILVVAINRDIVDTYFDLLKSLTLKPVALDINANGVMKIFGQDVLINQSEFTTQKTIAYIDIGAETIDINILSSGIYQFSKILDMGSRDIDIAIAKAFNVSLLQGQEIKKKKIFSNSDVNTIDILKNIVYTVISNWLREIDKIFKYYSSRKIENIIDTIYLYGGGSKILGIEEQFSKYLNIDTFKIKNISNIKKDKCVNNIDLDYYLNAIAAIKRLK